METISNESNETILRVHLKREGFKLTDKKSNGKLKEDLRATKGEVEYFVECIGYKRLPNSRSIDFFQSFFRAISRLDDGAKNIAIALPHLYLQGMESRLKNYKIAWKRLGQKFPELELWFVSEEGITRLKWNKVYDKYLKN